MTMLLAAKENGVARSWSQPFHGGPGTPSPAKEMVGVTELLWMGRAMRENSCIIIEGHK